MNRRHLLRSSACGFGHLALCGMLGSSVGGASSAGGSQLPSSAAFPTLHHLPRAKRVIFLFMQGGPSQVDTFDYKPELIRRHGQEVDLYNPRAMKVQPSKLFAPLWDFKRHGQTGRHVSSLFPQMAKHVDDLCFIHSMHTEGVAHGPATLFLHTGATNLIRPSMGAWVSYGLGAENQNLPSFVTVNPPANKGGARNYGNAFLPAAHQGTVLGQPGDPNARPEIRNLRGQGSPGDQKRAFDFLQSLNRTQSDGAASIEAIIQNYELAWRM